MDSGAAERASGCADRLGKSWLACALLNQACRQGFSACHLRVPKFNEEMAIAHGSGVYATLLAQWAKTDILVMDDLAMAPLADTARRDLFEVLDDRHGSYTTRAVSRSRENRYANAEMV
jgi:DNA replication protein DnaC